MLRTIFGTKKEAIRRRWEKLQIEWPHKLYCAQMTIKVIKSRRLRWAERVTSNGQIRNTYKVLIRLLERKRTFGKSKRKLG